MKNSYLINLALKNLYLRKLRSSLTIIGIAISASFICTLLAFAYGVQKIATDQIADNESIKILDVYPGSSVESKLNVNSIYKIKNNSQVSAVYPQIDVAGSVLYDSSQNESIIYGADTELVKLINGSLVAGSLVQYAEEGSAIINTKLVEKLSNSSVESLLGKTIEVTLAIQSDLKLDQSSNNLQKVNYRIVGVTDSGQSPYLFTPISGLQKLGIGNYSAAKVVVNKIDDVDIIKNQLELQGYKVYSIKTTIDQVNQFFDIFKYTLFGLGLISAIISALAMFNTLTISLLEKTREIGLMKVFGMRNKHIKKLFILEALIIGFIGGLVGVVSSLIFGSIVNQVIRRLALLNEAEPVSIFNFPPVMILLIFLSVLLISLLTGLYPSKRASKINPLDALRYE